MEEDTVYDFCSSLHLDSLLRQGYEVRSNKKRRFSTVPREVTPNRLFSYYRLSPLKKVVNLFTFQLFVYYTTVVNSCQVPRFTPLCPSLTLFS